MVTFGAVAKSDPRRGAELPLPQLKEKRPSETKEERDPRRGAELPLPRLKEKRPSETKVRT